MNESRVSPCTPPPSDRHQRPSCITSSARPTGLKPGDLYFLQTDRWYLERRIYLVVGISLIVASVLSLVYSAWWLLFTGFADAAMVWFAATGFCIMANGLYWLGARTSFVARARAARHPGVVRHWA
ncbi:MAG: DUF2892 domain-containing protein, partial [Rhodanobacter sp.]